jgi:hypothetical protein
MSISLSTILANSIHALFPQIVLILENKKRLLLEIKIILSLLLLDSLDCWFCCLDSGSSMVLLLLFLSSHAGGKVIKSTCLLMLLWVVVTAMVDLLVAVIVMFRLLFLLVLPNDWFLHFDDGLVLKQKQEQKRGKFFSSGPQHQLKTLKATIVQIAHTLTGPPEEDWAGALVPFCFVIFKLLFSCLSAGLVL